MTEAFNVSLAVRSPATNPSESAGVRLSEQMAELDLTWRQLAAWCGVGRSTVWKWRRDILPVPAYVTTILRQQKVMRRLAVMGRSAQPTVTQSSLAPNGQT